MDTAVQQMHDQLEDGYLTPRLTILSQNLYEQLFIVALKKTYSVVIKVIIFIFHN